MSNPFGVPGAGGEGEDQIAGFDGLLSQAMQMQQEMMQAQAQAADQVVEGQAGGGVVRVQVTGGMEFRSVDIDVQVVDPDDVEMLQDLVLAALHDAVRRVNELQAQSLGGLGDLLAGTGLGGSGLGDMLGLGAETTGLDDLVIDVDSGDSGDSDDSDDTA
jgi:nucleoid-associated protein EbfC